jgi:uncharacterized protein YjbI with pentapeptide repeats
MRRVSVLLGSAAGVGVIGGLAWYIARDSAGAPETTAIPVGAMVVLACVGLALVWSKNGIKNARRDIGTALLTGLIVGAVIVWLQFAVQHSIDRSAERQNLRLTLNLQHDLVGIDVNHQDLRGLYLSYKDLRHANLRYTLLQHTELPGSDLAYAYMEGTDLYEAVLSGTQLSQVRLQKAHAVGASFIEARGTQAKLSGDFERAVFNHAVLPRAYLVHADLKEAELEHADFLEAEGEHADIEDSHLAHANFEKSELSFANFRGADTAEVNFTDAYLDGTILTGALNLDSACLSGATYNALTRWPTGFDPRRAGAVREGSNSTTAQTQPTGHCRDIIRARAGTRSR